MYLTSSGVVLKKSGAATAYTSAVGGSRSVFGSRDNDMFYGFAGSVLVGGTGNDTYNVWDPSFTITELANEGVDTLNSYAWGQTILPRGVENLFLLGGGSSSGIGNELNNIIVSGNASAMLDGGAADDVLVGGKGADIFRIKAGNGSDAIVNFQTGWDVIKLEGYKFASFDQVRSATTQVGADSLINLGNGERLVLRSLAADSLTAADFGFSSVGSSVARTAAGASTLVGPGAIATFNGVTVLNNTWGAGGLKYGTDYAIQTTYTAGNAASGLTFNWTFPASTDVFQTVKAYPEIIFGVSPYGGATTYVDAAHSFPVKVSDIGGLTATFDTSISGNKGGFNVAFDIWLTSKPFGDASTITNELMIWTHRPATEIFGTKVGTFSDGVNSGSIWHEGTYTALVLDTETPRGTIDIAAVLTTLKKLGIVSDSEYLASVQFGSEVMSGTGSLSINNFQMNLQTTDANGNVVIKEISGAGTAVYQQKAPAVAPTLEAVKDEFGLLIGYQTATLKTSGKEVTLFDTAGNRTGSDLVKTSGKTVTTEHYSETSKLVGLDVETVVKAGTVTTKHYDAARKLVGSETVITTATGETVSHYDKNGLLVSTDSTRVSGNSEVTEHYNANWQRLGAEVVWHYPDGTRVVGRADANWKQTGYDEYSSVGGIAKERNYDANYKLAGGSETHVDASGVTIRANFDKAWAQISTEFTATKGDDLIALKDGTNFVHGGVGSDRIFAGRGQDTFHFDTAIGKDVDTVFNFSVAQDSIVLNRAVFTGLTGSALANSAFTIGTAATKASDRIIYDDKSGALYFDVDGTGAKAAILFAQLDPHLALTSANFHLA